MHTIFNIYYCANKYPHIYSRKLYYKFFYMFRFLCTIFRELIYIYIVFLLKLLNIKIIKIIQKAVGFYLLTYSMQQSPS